ncbi:MAG: ABC transporter ATP-binding protein [Planctomycetaceae bacterium]
MLPENSHSTDAPKLLVALEQLSGIGDQAVDRQLARRSLSEACSARPGEIREYWWSWLVEAGHSLGQRFRVVDCEPDEAIALMQQGARVAVYLPDEQHPWLISVGAKRRWIQIVDEELDHPRWILSRLLRKRLADSGIETLRVVYVDSIAETGDLISSSEEPLSPWSRVLALLKPEWPDIWIILVFALFVGLMTLATPIAVEALVNTVAFGRLVQPVVILATLLFGFLGFAAAMRAFQTWVVEIIQRRLFVRVAGDLAFRLPRLEISALRGKYAPELMNRFFDVVIVQKLSATLLLDGIALVLGALIGMTVLAFYHPWLLAFDFLLLVMILFIVFVLGRGAVGSAIKESKSKYKTAAWLEDLARCQTAFRYDGAPEFASERADHLVEYYLTQRKRHFRILFRQILFALTLQAIASTILLGLGGWLVISGELTLGQLVAAELIVTVIVGSFAKLGKHMESFYDLLASVDKLGILFDLPVEPQHGAISVASEGGASVGFRQVQCHGMSQPVDLDLAPGDRLAVTGPAGSGKTVLAQRLFGLGSTAHGHLELDGIDLRDLRRDVLRHHVALVHEVEIFEGTISENIALERTNVSHGNIRDALETVGLLETVLDMPDGLDTSLTSGGEPLSDSQARRLMLARAIAGQPRLLVIDGILDGFSDADSIELADRLLSGGKGRTVVVTTGRNGIAELCNRRLDLGTQTSFPNRLDTSTSV